MKRLKTLQLPRSYNSPQSHADYNTHGTLLGREINSRGPDSTNLSGHTLLRNGKDAFAARVHLARSAERTIDVQYYIWRADLSGSLLLDELEAAAKRGVRVRLIVDDVGTARLDDRLTILAEHPNFDVRLYNPCVVRWPKAINYFFDFHRLNLRMHAKSFTVDSQATIVGGRNIGDEYFAVRPEGQFADLDVLAVGAVIPDVSKAFDACWNGPDVHPVNTIARSVSSRRRQKVERVRHRLATSTEADRYRHDVSQRRLLGEMIDGTMTMIWAPTRLINHDYSDRPRGVGPNDLSTLVPTGVDLATLKMDIISGYFVPTSKGAKELADLAKKGVQVRVLTNSYAATDVGLVHSGYAPARSGLLEGGVKLFEMPAPDDKPKTAAKYVRSTSPNARFFRDEGRSLHAKVIGVDDRQVYIGSANFDPRSAHLNTELGFLIESPELAKALCHSFDQDIAHNVYCLSLGPRGDLRWTDARDDEPELETPEPGTTLFSRALFTVLSKLPIERYL